MFVVVGILLQPRSLNGLAASLETRATDLTKRF